jgi:hypothetical protein
MNAANPVTPRHSGAAATASTFALVMQNETDTHGWRDGWSSGAQRWLYALCAVLPPARG